MDVFLALVKKYKSELAHNFNYKVKEQKPPKTRPNASALVNKSQTFMLNISTPRNFEILTIADSVKMEAPYLPPGL